MDTEQHETPPDMQQQMDTDVDTHMEEVTESPADAPGSGRRRPLRRLGAAGTPVAGSSALLQKVLGDLEEEDGGQHEMGGDSSPVERRVATRRAARRRAESGAGAGFVSGGLRLGGSPLAGRRSKRLSGGSSVVAESEVGGMEGGERLVGVVEEEEMEVVEEVEESTVLEPGEDDEVQVEEEQDEEQEEAQEVGEKEAAQRLGRKRPRGSPRAPSPELGTSIAEESPALKRRRRREVASPAQQQQPAKKPRGRPPARPQPPRQPSPEPSPQPQRRPQAQTQAKAKPTAKKRQPKKKKKPADDEDAEAPSGSVPVTVQRFTKPARTSAAADGEDEASTDLLNGEIPFSSRGGVNAVDVLSKLCEELIEAYMDKLEERGRAAEDAATRREQKTMYRTLEAFQEELRTRLLEHVSVAVLKFWLFGGG
jgi:hypothetical protein